MNIEWGVLVEIAVPIVAAIVGAYCTHAFENRSRLVTYYGHVAAFEVNKGTNDELVVHTHSVVLRNAGRKSARNVRIGHLTLPDFRIAPAIEHEVREIPGGGAEIRIPVLVPGKEITVSYLYFPPTTWEQVNTPIESDEGIAKALLVLPTPQLPPWTLRTLRVLVVVGAIAVLYALLEILIWIARR